nr:hypothetical protein BaRGS_028288 [Batillaria attramentaria]
MMTKHLIGMIDEVAGAHSDWTDAQSLQGGVAAYNCGAGRIRLNLNKFDYGTIDKYTTHLDYSNDVIARAKLLKRSYDFV